MNSLTDTELLTIKTIRMLAVDAVEKAQSGHPGLPMEAAAIAYTLWMRHMRYNPAHPEWMNRDRFVLSAGHGSMLLYAMLHLTGYEVSLDDIRGFRSWGSITPGHPEYRLTPGVEMTTGPLGQGFATGVGMALAERLLAQRFNTDGRPVVDYRIYGLVSDGDLMEGVSAEAASYAGSLPLGNLIYVYLSNRITIEGSTDLAFTEDTARRFDAYGWHTVQVEDGNDVEAIDRALEEAKQDSRPSLILARTTIGFGSPGKQGTAAAHGAPLGAEEVRRTKEHASWPLEPTFFVPEEVREHCHTARARGEASERAWNALWEEYTVAHPDDAHALRARMSGEVYEPRDVAFPAFPPGTAPLATREASGATLRALAARMPELVGGSADLGPSNNTELPGFGHVTAVAFEGDARNLHFGVREHAMGAIANGLALSRAFVPFVGTFFMFSDYMRPAMRMAALMKLRVVYVCTHDSIGQGEDGRTHQPVEHLASFRAMPNMTVVRPSDATETVEAWRYALRCTEGPTLLVLTRQKVPVIDRTRYAPASGLARGAYVVNPEVTEPSVLVIATGSEVSLALAAADTLAERGVSVRVVSMPSWEVFEEQDASYRELVLPVSVRRRVVVEAGVRFGWERYAGAHGAYVTVDTFGASAPGAILFEQYGITVAHIIEEVSRLLDTR